MSLQKALILSAVFVVGACAQCPSGLTQITDTIDGPISASGTPTLFNGTITIRLAPEPITLGGQTYGLIPLIVRVRNGAFTGCLAPNDTASPQGTYYEVEYAYSSADPVQGSAKPWSEMWLVTTSGSALQINQVRLLTSPPALVGATGPAGPTGPQGPTGATGPATPSSSSASCTQGTINWDANYIYICTAANTWKRAALSTF